MTENTTTGGRCECGNPVSPAKSHRGRRPIRCENCRRFLSQINTLRGNWSRNLTARANRKPRNPRMTDAEKTRRYMERRYREIDEMPKISCACGCGTLIAPINKLLKPATFAHGHNESGLATQFKPDQRRGALNINWKGGRKRHHSGYVAVLVGKGHPMAKAGTGYALEHRLVMSVACGRTLRRDEEVHHINGIKDDNRIENLQLRQKGHGAGAAYRCCDCGSQNVEPTQLLDSKSGQTHLVLGGDQ